MARRKHRRPAAPSAEPASRRAEDEARGLVPPAPVVPFHSPFRDLASTYKPKPAPPSAAPSPAPRAAAPQARHGKALHGAKLNGPAKDDAAESALSDAEALALSMAGVERLAPLAPRVRIRPRPDLSHIEAKRQADLEAMARAEGFDIAHEDRYVRARASGVSRETLGRLERGEFRISAHLDLHRMPLDEARRAVDEFLAEQQKKGRRCVLIVTGKGKNSPRGEGVLREQVPQWLARGPSARRVLAFASARPCDGGLGALVVLMRGSSSSKNRIEVEHGGVGPIKA